MLVLRALGQIRNCLRIKEFRFDGSRVQHEISLKLTIPPLPGLFQVTSTTSIKGVRFRPPSLSQQLRSCLLICQIRWNFRAASNVGMNITISGYINLWI